MNREIIYVNLLDEGTPVLKPVLATHQQNNIYEIIVDEVQDDDKYEFPPGSCVIVEQRLIDSKSVLVAIKLATISA